MTEIDKLIEQEALNRLNHLCETNFTREELTTGHRYWDLFAFWRDGASFVLHQNRWRKVEEELPKIKDEEYQILIRIMDIPTSATVWNIRNQSDCDIIRKMTNSEWKPIE